VAGGNFIWIGGIRELSGVVHADSHVDIGAATTLAETGEILKAGYPELEELVRRIASPTITRSATIGGNLVNASPVGDFIPVLLALGASLALRSSTTSRRVPLEAFYQGYRQTCLRPGELVESVRVPVRRSDQRVGAYKVAKRFEQDTTTVLGAFSVRLRDDIATDVRISFGGLSDTQCRAHPVERALSDEPWTDRTIVSAVSALRDHFEPISDLRGTSEFRLEVAANLLRKFHLATTTDQALSLWRAGGPRGRG
jgi:xanthine dehydrogenase small subunit